MIPHAVAYGTRDQRKKQLDRQACNAPAYALSSTAISRTTTSNIDRLAPPLARSSAKSRV
jgi:hypothetical protein